MKTNKSLLILIALLALGLLGVALYLQHILGMQPCPLCVIQRYAFAAIALSCLIAAALPPNGERIGSGLGALVALAGAGVAAWHLHVKANPSVSCGIDPLETSLNHFFTADLLPFLFKADGLCSADYAPILGLSIPQWSLLWFALFGVMLMRITFKRH
ncbi:disulfide bond formation protein B [uncultured Oxalicibacterium sp.]|uniref:disulfide bond formation protein B n=1 Tax=uncultured Oxalicibacterium sp. TaxID=1168540 RepID=UPI0025DFC8DF|nr:disulfide bond formation protein B [uncultured Oxalicibacterium sp.]